MLQNVCFDKLNVLCLCKIVHACHMFLYLYLPLLFFKNKQITKKNNISVISWRSDFLGEENGVPGENHRPLVFKHHNNSNEHEYLYVLQCRMNQTIAFLPTFGIFYMQYCYIEFSINSMPI